MDFKKTRIKQIETALKTLNERFNSLVENDFEEIEDFKVQAVAEGMNLLDNYFESLKNDEDPEVEELRRKYNELMDSMSGHNPI
ncbi:MAG: hypothetical protein ACOCRX_11835 [Candidatus Woesearchaeota archaeon]